MKSPILCLYGPPGVGKLPDVRCQSTEETSHVFPGRLHDESEIRGHRRTYMPMAASFKVSTQQIIQSRPCADEIDKVGTDFRGDPPRLY